MFPSFGPLTNMKSKIVPCYMNGNSSNLFCIFPRDYDSSSSSYCPPGSAPVYLNVYDISSINSCLSWTGLGVFHTGLEVHGVEYGFGCHQESESGVFEIEPQKCPGFNFRKSILMGTTNLTPSQVQRFMELQSNNYYGDTYHLIGKNCNHFCEDMCYKLTGNQIPRWVNRLARIGSCCRCILPGALKGSSIGNESKCDDYEKKSYRSWFSCFSSVSRHDKLKRISISSLYKHSLYKGCLPPWELRSDSERLSVCDSEEEE